MIFELIISIVIAGYLRKTFQTKFAYPQWDKELSFILYAAIALLVTDVMINTWHPVIKWVSNFLLLYLVYFLFAKKEVDKIRAVLYAIAPFIILSLFSDISELASLEKYTTWKNLLDVALIFSFLWMLVMWIIATRQNKALDKEKRKAKEEEVQKELMESMKDQLEVQVAERTSELTRQKEELQHALEELKSTQALLIHSEKMASLGELTAGIAHEIQNPLNFVNNFSEVSNELVDEMNIELQNGDIESAKAIAADVKQNLEKINHHGKRAGDIVKGMLQHSRTSTGQKEVTDINALCDEYLRLSFHGLRAKDKSFNAKFEAGFDPTLPKINVVPQDIGRVILNLINNAFYAAALPSSLGRKEANHIPTVCVSTKRERDTALITIKDNGPGIPKEILDKIFQPFFTTKPTGQGTGLGLSLSYDIVKAHGGEIKVETKENEGTEFIIWLPIV